MLSVMIVSPVFAQISVSGVDTISAAATQVADVDPVFTVVGYVIEGLYKVFPKYAPVIQFCLELLASIATFFTLLVAFVSGVLKIPLVVSRWVGATAFEAKVQKIYEKCLPFLNKLKKLSMFNATKK
jgi:hypothetical protein